MRKALIFQFLACIMLLTGCSRDVPNFDNPDVREAIFNEAEDLRSEELHYDGEDGLVYRQTKEGTNPYTGWRKLFIEPTEDKDLHDLKELRYYKNGKASGPWARFYFDDVQWKLRKSKEGYRYDWQSEKPYSE